MDKGKKKEDPIYIEEEKEVLKKKNKVPKDKEPLFSSLLYQDLYEAKFKERRVILGKTLNFVELKDNGCDVVPYCQRLHWINFFAINELVYPHLIRAFYAAINIDLKGPALTETIKGKDFLNDENII